MDYGKSRDPYNQTNSNDPMSVRSRVFVGNLNTEKCTREFLQNIFGKYGLVHGASVMKGYGFVQFADEFTARRAVQAEDGNVYFGQQVDCNLACEPKSKHGKGGRKRKADGQGDSSDGVYDYSSDYWSAAGYPGMPGVAPLMGQAMPGMMYPGYPPQMDPAAAWYAAAGAPPPPPGVGPQPLMEAAPFGSHPKAGGIVKKPKPYGAGAGAGAAKRESNNTGFIQYPHLSLKKKQTTAAGGTGQAKPPVKPAAAATAAVGGKEWMQCESVRLAVMDKREKFLQWKKTQSEEDHSKYIEARRKAKNLVAKEVYKLSGPTRTDVLFCGRCKTQFADLEKLVAHKRTTPQCSPRTICTCDADADTPSALACARCDVTVLSAWDLLGHYRDVHDTELHKPLTPIDTEMSK